MEHTQFKQVLPSLGMSASGFSELIGRTPQRVSNWKQDKVPEWVPAFINALKDSQKYHKIKLLIED